MEKYKCKFCNGRGYLIEKVEKTPEKELHLIFCKPCSGLGNYDWLEVIFGIPKERKYSKRMRNIASIMKENECDIYSFEYYGKFRISFFKVE